MDPSCLVSTVHVGSTGVMAWVTFYWHIFATANLSIVADDVLPFMTTVCPSCNGYFKLYNVPGQKAHIISDWFLEHDNEFTLLKWPPVTSSQSNRAPLGCGGTGDTHHGCAADKSAATV